MIKEKAIETLQIEADAVKKLINHIDDEFETIVNAILACNGRVIVTGMGKSGHVGRKIAASLASTGTPDAPERSDDTLRRVRYRDRDSSHRASIKLLVFALVSAT